MNGTSATPTTDQGPALSYVSTRGQSSPLAFDDVLLAGLASDGGLFVPSVWPQLESASPRTAARSYTDIALEVMEPFVQGAIDPHAFRSMVIDSYSVFDAPDVTPLVDLDGGQWLLELFHGPTLAFKDIALQLVGRLIDHVLTERSERITILCATSGDTGSAAMAACEGREAVDLFVLFPEGRTSEIQRLQMTTPAAPNVHAIAVDGTFDDCQDLVKAMFGDEQFRERLQLGAMNSINWARVMAQIVYYVVASERLTGRSSPISFAVPTGNFGNVLAGWCAKSMGLPVEHLVVASNRNDILTRFFASGSLEMGDVVPTLSPSMDIQISSNLERLLFEMHDRDAAAVSRLLTEFRSSGTVSVDEQRMAGLRDVWQATRIDDDGPGGTTEIIADVYRRHGVLIDPHTAVGVGAARAHADPDVPMVTLATAHPAKFPDAIEVATGVRPPLPPHLADLFDRPERCTPLPNDLAAVENFIEGRARIVIGA